MNAIEQRLPTCAACGSAVDSLYFDVAGFAAVPERDGTVILVRQEIPRQYCAVLEGFQQFVPPELLPDGPVETRLIQWSIRANGRPLDPYTGFHALLNRWGEPWNRVAINLEEGTMLELVARFLAPPRTRDTSLRVGGRLMGRYWFDDPYGTARARPK